MNVGQHRHLEPLAHFCQRFESSLEPEAPIAVNGASVGLVVTGFEDVRNAQFARQLRHLLRYLKITAAVFQHARPGDESEGAVVADSNAELLEDDHAHAKLPDLPALAVSWRH